MRLPSLAFASFAIAALCATPPLAAQASVDSAALRRAVAQLRGTIGRWEVETRFLNPDGSVARAVQGTYEFSWVVPDRVVSGRSDIPELGQRSAILFYVRPGQGQIEMVSVGADGMLWTMTGPMGEETRTSQPFDAGNGRTGKLRFTRSNITADAFESKMEVTTDDGRTWSPGNHQFFRRATTATTRSPDRTR